MDAEALLARFIPREHTETVPVISLLELVRNESVSQVDIAEQSHLSRRAINRTVNEFTNIGLLKQTTDGYRLTGAGAIAHHQYTTATDEVDEKALRFCSDSQNRVSILEALQEHPARKADLAARSELPSRSTVGRAITVGEDLGLVTAGRRGDYTLTSYGETVLTTYSELKHAFEQLLVYAPCLQNIGVECADLPVGALDGARLVERQETRQLIELFELAEYIASLDPAEIDHIRLFSSFFNQQLSDAIAPLVQSDTRLDMISPASALGGMPTAEEAKQHIAEGLEAENCRWYLYPGELPAGILIVDEEEIVIGPSTPDETGDQSGNIYCSDPEAVEWAIEIYDEYYQESSEPFEYLVGWLKDESQNLLDSVSPDLLH